MMWTDTGFLLSKIAFQENSIIANFYTKKHGKCAGIIYGATSKKIKNYLQNGNELYLEYYSKSDNSLGYFKTYIKRLSRLLAHFNFKDPKSYCSSSWVPR